MKVMCGWGRLTQENYHLMNLDNRSHALESIKRKSSIVFYGNGRSYGDMALNISGSVFKTTGLDRFISFDITTGLLSCEAGILLRDIQAFIVPQGWILPVSPGTQLITVGGAIANDIHGKNHHQQGTFCHHVVQMTLARTSGEIIECGPQKNSDWFSATVGGAGLTGLILTATLQLKKINGPWLNTETIPYNNLTDFFDLADSSEDSWEHTVSWIDRDATGGRGLFMRANHSSSIDSPPKLKANRDIFFEPPFSLVNKFSLKLFNASYFYLNKLNSGIKKIHYIPFFYPLDGLLNWNKIYGPTGFFQYQSVVPFDNAKDVTKSMLQIIKKSGEGSFLSVLKTFGQKPSIGMLSFVRPGVTLAMDFPNRGAKTEKLFLSLDAVVRESGGRLYLAKDARMPRDLFETGYPNFKNFLKYRDQGIVSSLSKRLFGDI
jgi:FAD/FMN-containing dehydrogenase